MAREIAFPFERGRLSSIRELRTFEAELLVARRRDQGLSRMLRDPRRSAPEWMRLRNKELVPLMLFADHIGLNGDDQFLLKPEGDPVDAEIMTGGRKLNLQITLAGPIWGSGNAAQQNSGYQHHQIMVALNENEVVSGYPPFTKENGVAIGAVDVIRKEDRDRACRSGLSAAISRKAIHDGRGGILIVFAQEFYMQLLEASLLRALVDSVISEYHLSFDSICVFDSHPGFFVERPLTGHRWTSSE